MKGKCKYCGVELPDIANIRCDKCNRAFQEGMDLGNEMLKEDVGNAVKLLLSCAGLLK